MSYKQHGKIALQEKHIEKQNPRSVLVLNMLAQWQKASFASTKAQNYHGQLEKEHRRACSVYAFFQLCNSACFAKLLFYMRKNEKKGFFFLRVIYNFHHVAFLERHVTKL